MNKVILCSLFVSYFFMGILSSTETEVEPIEENEVDGDDEFENTDKAQVDVENPDSDPLRRRRKCSPSCGSGFRCMKTCTSRCLRRPPSEDSPLCGPGGQYGSPPPGQAPLGSAYGPGGACACGPYGPYGPPPPPGEAPPPGSAYGPGGPCACGPYGLYGSQPPGQAPPGSVYGPGGPCECGPGGPCACRPGGPCACGACACGPLGSYGPSGPDYLSGKPCACGPGTPCDCRNGRYGRPPPPGAIAPPGYPYGQGGVCGLGGRGGPYGPKF